MRSVYRETCLRRCAMARKCCGSRAQEAQFSSGADADSRARPGADVGVVCRLWLWGVMTVGCGRAGLLVDGRESTEGRRVRGARLLHVRQAGGRHHERAARIERGD